MTKKLFSSFPFTRESKVDLDFLWASPLSSFSISSSTESFKSFKHALQMKARVENDLGGKTSGWSNLCWWMEILFDCWCYGDFFCRLLALFLLLLLLHKHERQHAQKAAHGNSQNAALFEFKSRLGASINLLHLNKSLTMFEARRDDFISSWTGVKSGGRIPITSTNRST